MICRTLIVEDDNVTRRAMTRLLQSWGHPTLAAGSLAEALELIDGDYGCVVTDLNLPDGSGTEVLRHLKEEHPSVRVAVATGSDDAELLAEVGRLKPDALFFKPVDLGQLAAWIGGDA